MSYSSKVWISTLLALGVLVIGRGAQATLVTDSLDPEYTHVFQAASAQTFAGLGYSVGTGASDLKVYTNTWADPSGLHFGTIVPALAHITGAGFTYDKIGYGYGGTGNPLPGNARDYDWIQNSGSNFTSNPALDTPWNGSIWNLGGQANQAVVFPIVDHGPLPNEAVEYTVYLTNNPTSTNLSDWNLAILDSVYLEGWESDNVALADGFTTVWKLPGGATFQYVSVQGVGSQAIQPISGDEDEIDAVAGLSENGDPVGSVPEPVSALLTSLGLGSITLAACRRRR